MTDEQSELYAEDITQSSATDKNLQTSELPRPRQQEIGRSTI